MPVPGSRGIDNDDVTKPGTFHPVAQHRLGDWGATDISKTDGGDSVGLVAHRVMLTSEGELFSVHSLGIEIERESGRSRGNCFGYPQVIHRSYAGACGVVPR